MLKRHMVNIYEVTHEAILSAPAALVRPSIVRTRNHRAQAIGTRFLGSRPTPTRRRCPAGESAPTWRRSGPRDSEGAAWPRRASTAPTTGGDQRLAGATVVSRRAAEKGMPPPEDTGAVLPGFEYDGSSGHGFSSQSPIAEVGIVSATSKLHTSRKITIVHQRVRKLLKLHQKHRGIDFPVILVNLGEGPSAHPPD